MSNHAALGFAIAGTVVSHPSLFVAMYKYIFFNQWKYPFYSIIFVNGVLFLMGIAYFFYKLHNFKNIQDSVFIYKAIEIIQISLLYCGWTVLTVYSLSWSHMTTSRYLMLQTPCDFLFLGIGSVLIMKRGFTPYHWIAVLISTIGFFISDVFKFNGTWQYNFTVSATAGWQGPVCCLFSRLCYILMCFLNKKMLLKKGLAQKLKLKKERDRKRDPLEDEELDENGSLKNRVVSYDSILYKKSALNKRGNMNLKRNQIDSIQKKLEAEENKINQKKGQLFQKQKQELLKKKKQLNNESNVHQNYENELVANLIKKSEGRTNRALEKYRLKMKENLLKQIQAEQGETTSQNPNFRLTNMSNKTEMIENMEIMNKINDVVPETMEIKKFEKEKLLLQELLENESKEHLELETMILDYDDVHFHMHFFDGMDDIKLTKIDTLLDNPIYDAELNGYDFYTTFELYGIAGSLALFPMSCICSFLAAEVPDAYNQMVSQQIDGPFGDGVAPLIVACLFSILYALRPFSIQKLVFTVSLPNYYCIQCFIHFFLMFLSVIFVDTAAGISSTFGAGAMFSILSYGIYYATVAQSYAVAECKTNLELVKTCLPNDFSDADFEMLENRCLEIRNSLGVSGLNRLLLDLAATQCPSSLMYTANAYLPIRVFFDKEYFSRITDWGGGYPRPWVESIERLWKADDGLGVILPNDPELENIAESRKKKILKEAEEIEQIKLKKIEAKHRKVAVIENKIKEEEEEKMKQRLREEAEQYEKAKELERLRKEKEKLEREAFEKLEAQKLNVPFKLFQPMNPYNQFENNQKPIDNGDNVFDFTKLKKKI